MLKKNVAHPVRRLDFAVECDVHAVGERHQELRLYVFSLFRAVFASLFVPSVTYQPGGTVYPTGDPIVNGSMFVALTDTDLFGAYFILYLPMWGKP